MESAFTKRSITAADVDLVCSHVRTYVDTDVHDADWPDSVRDLFDIDAPGKRRGTHGHAMRGLRQPDAAPYADRLHGSLLHPDGRIRPARHRGECNHQPHLRHK